MHKSPVTLSHDESFLLLDYLIKGYSTPGQQKKAVRNHAIGVILLDAGLRVSELCGLRICDLYFADEPRTSIHLAATTTKRNVARTVPLTTRIKQEIIAMSGLIWIPNSLSLDRFAFTTNDYSCPLTPRQVERIIGKAGLAVLQRQVTPHMLRHTFGTRLMRTTNIRIVQQLLGHKHLSSTQIYTHPSGEDLSQAIETLNQ